MPDERTPLPKTSNPATAAINLAGVYFLEDLARFPPRRKLPRCTALGSEGNPHLEGRPQRGLAFASDSSP